CANGVRQRRAQLRRERLGYTDVGDQSLTKKGALAAPREVEELIGNHNVARRVILAERAAGTDGDDIAHAKLFQSEDVGPVGYLARRQHMSPAVSRQEGNAPAVKRADGDGVGGRAERCARPDHLLDVEVWHIV